MITIIEKIQTKDGSLFDTEKQAIDYITDEMCSDLNEIIKGMKLYNMPHRDLLTFIIGLTGTIDNAKALKAILDKHID